jgi:hypothetical protein
MTAPPTSGAGRPPAPADQGSLAMAMIFVVVAFGLTALLVPVMLVQSQQTRHVTQRVNALVAAQAGLDRGLAQIRAAVEDGTTLPCAVQSRVGTDTTARYDLTVSYLSDDGQALACPPAGAPATARLTSVGTTKVGAAPASSRTLSARYRFRFSNANVMGGRIHVLATSTSVDRCMDAGSEDPAPGTVLRMQDCVEGSPRQMFGYTGNLTIVLMAGVTAKPPKPMCLEAPPADGQFVTFQPCASPTTPAQQWSLNDYSNFVGTTDGVNLNEFCFNSQTANSVGSVAGSPVLLRTGPYCNGGGDDMQSFAPETSVGAGAAGAAKSQLVNYAQFGRCIDVTRHNPAIDFLIVFPCKQTPNAAGPSWNQRWSLPAGGTGHITTRSDSDGKLYCLRSPGSAYDSAARGPYVRVVECATAVDGVTWTVNGETDSYATGYTIRNGDGLCLAAVDQNAGDNWDTGDRVAKLSVASCSDSLLQKWNAPANLTDSRGLKDYTER